MTEHLNVTADVIIYGLNGVLCADLFMLLRYMLLSKLGQLQHLWLYLLLVIAVGHIDKDLCHWIQDTLIWHLQHKYSRKFAAHSPTKSQL